MLVILRENVENLGRIGDVVHVTRPADAVADRGPRHEARGVERTELLRDAAPGRSERCGDRVRCGRAAPAQVDEDRATIAGVIYNRLDAGQTLGIDATLLYDDPTPDGSGVHRFAVTYDEHLANVRECLGG